MKVSRSNAARRIHLAALSAILLVLLLTLAPVRAQEPLQYLTYSVLIDLHLDGSFDVRTVQTIQFDGEYDTAFIEIPTGRASALRDVQVYQAPPATGFALPQDEELSPLTTNVAQEGQTLLVDWEYPLTSSGDVRTFVIDYSVDGGLWVYPDADFLNWPAINAERSGVPVSAGQVTVTLPPEIPVEMITASVPNANGALQIDGRNVVFTPNSALPDGEAFPVEVGFPHGIIAAQPQAWQKEADQRESVARIASFDTTIAIQPDGRLDVREAIRMAVEQGAIYSGFRSMRLLYMDDVVDVAVAQDGEPLPAGADGCERCYALNRSSGWSGWVSADEETGALKVNEDDVTRLDVNWWVAGVPSGEETEFDLTYSVEGGIRIGADDQVITWEALPDYDLSVESASLRIVPPAGVNPADVRVESDGAEIATEAQEDGSLLVRASDLPAQRPRWPVVITLPAAATSANIPVWQQQFEQAVAQGEAFAVANARQQLAWRTGGALALVAAVLAAIFAWLRWGRKRAKELLNGYVSEPPSELAPGIVAYLVDQQASERGVLASLFHLASFGVLGLELENGVQLVRKVDQPLKNGSMPQLADGKRAALAPHLISLFDEVVLPATGLNRSTPLDQLAPTLRSRLPQIYAQMGKDAQTYFLATGGTRAAIGCLTPYVVLFSWFTFAMLIQVGNIEPMAPLLVGSFVLLILFLLLRSFLRRRSTRSASGETELKRWLAFKNYLLHLKEFGNLAAAQEILDRNFAYAVALGAEEIVLAQAEEMGGSTPRWLMTTATRPFQPRPSFDADQPASSATTVTEPNTAANPPSFSNATTGSAARPSLSGMSRGLGNTVSTASAGMAGLLQTAAGDAGVATTVTLNSALRQHQLSWAAGTSPTKMLDDIMRQSMADVKTLRTPVRAAMSRSSGGGGSSWGGGSSSGSSSSGSRSSGGFSSSSSRSSSSSSRSSSSSSSSRSSSGGRSGFGKK